MMRRLLRRAAGFGAGVPVLAMACAMILASGQAARAGDANGLLCRRDEVAQVVARELRARDYYAAADFSTVAEQPTLEWGVVRCTIAVFRCADRCTSPWRDTADVQSFGYFVRLANRRFTVLFDAD